MKLTKRDLLQWGSGLSAAAAIPFDASASTGLAEIAEGPFRALLQSL